MSTPLITVVTINRNNSYGLSSTLTSFLPIQSDPDIEFLLIDGASTDNSVDIASKFYPPQQIWSEPDKGIYDAMNKGLGYARGTYVIWINSGDQILHHSVAAAKSLLRHSSASVFAFAVEIDQSTQTSSDTKYLTFYNTLQRLPFQPLHHQGVFIRRHKAIQYRCYPTKYLITADRALILAMYLSAESFHFSSLKIARCEPQGVSSNAFARESENYDIDLKSGLIGYSTYFTGKTRSLLYHRLTIPVWNILKIISRAFGISNVPTPRLLTRLFKEPYRS